VLQFLIEEALLERLDLEDALAKGREAEELQSREAVDGSLRRREQALKAAG
jgi:hypothetical protein